MLDAAHEVLKVGDGGDVVVVGLEDHVGVDECQGPARRLHLGQAALVGSVEKAVHIRELDLVVVKEDELAHAAAHEHLRGDGAHTTHAHDDDRLFADAFVVGHHAHLLEGHEAGVGVGVHDLVAQFVHLIALLYLGLGRRGVCGHGGGVGRGNGKVELGVRRDRGGGRRGPCGDELARSEPQAEFTCSGRWRRRCERNDTVGSSNAKGRAQGASRGARRIPHDSAGRSHHARTLPCECRDSRTRKGAHEIAEGPVRNQG
mmetsp:Transcript_930/g.2578  ORF Transcript_930/g.2578 Transcript_930/m.2578 type:complete len:259 (-) Transcript_930:207-983(-)